MDARDVVCSDSQRSLYDRQISSREFGVGDGSSDEVDVEREQDVGYKLEVLSFTHAG